MKGDEFKMEFYIESEKFDIELLKFEHAMECANDICKIDFDDSLTRVNPEVFIEASLSDLKDKVSKAINKLLEMITEFCHKIRVEIQIKSQQISLNKKLKEMKDIFAKKRDRAVNKTTNFFDVYKYEQFYTDFINRYTKELIRGLDKNFTSIAEFEKWQKDMERELSDFNYKLSNEEIWSFSTAISSAVKLSEEQANNREKNIIMIEKHGNSSLKILDSEFKKINPEKFTLDVKEPKLKNKIKAISNRKVSFFTFVCSKLAQAIKTVVTMVSKHAFLCVTSLLVVLIAL